jgi:hypothetical protein
MNLVHGRCGVGSELRRAASALDVGSTRGEGAEADHTETWAMLFSSYHSCLGGFACVARRSRMRDRHENDLGWRSDMKGVLYEQVECARQQGRSA